MKKFFITFSSALILSACGNQSLDFQPIGQSGLIEYCVIDNHPDSIIPKSGDVLFLNFDYFTEDGQLVYSSNEVAQNFRMYAPDNAVTGTIEEGLFYMHKGDSAIFRAPAGIFFEKVRKAKLPQSIKPDDNLIFHIRINDIRDGGEYQRLIDEYNEKMEAQEMLILHDYIRNQNVDVKPNESGLYKVITMKGKGTETAEGKTVTIHFVGSFVDGREFDNSYKRNQPFKFTLGQGKSIPGFEEGIATMTKGEKCRLIMPSKLGYGSRGVNGRIPPFSTLIFDVELIDFE